MKLIKFTNGAEVYFINPEQVSMVEDAGEGRATILTSGGMQYTVDGDVLDVVFRLGGVRP